jgi:hypothetical protein
MLTQKRNELDSISKLKEFINSDLKDYQKYKESVILCESKKNGHVLEEFV